ncbi:MAG: protein phosphatase 2C domain-containing protein [Desulfarculaceae bacterium]|nr:protein phosphatase 2C domain-containing protein [Desulfarculaceae bacterium]
MIPVVTSEQCRFWKKREDVYRISGMNIAAKTDIGLKRKTNQDRYLVRQVNGGRLLILVADGLGGEPGGQTASEYVMDCAERLAIGRDQSTVSKMQAFFETMDRDVALEADRTGILEGMATTLTAVVVEDRTVHWVHSGDSRLYHIQNRQFRQITQDQTLARFLIREGELSPKESRGHYSEKVLDQCIGCRDLEPDSGKFFLGPEDMLILATDGLNRHVPDWKTQQVCDQARTCDQAAQNLVDHAIGAGGRDNVTVVVLKNKG